MLTQNDVSVFESYTDSEREKIFGKSASEGKYVIASDLSLAVLSLSSNDIYHVDALEDATKALLDASWVSSTDPDYSKPLAGITIGGGKFKIDFVSGKVTLYGRSGTFGDPKDGIFDEPTREIVQREIEALKACFDRIRKG